MHRIGTSNVTRPGREQPEYSADIRSETFSIPLCLIKICMYTIRCVTKWPSLVYILYFGCSVRNQA